MQISNKYVKSYQQIIKYISKFVKVWVIPILSFALKMINKVIKLKSLRSQLLTNKQNHSNMIKKQLHRNRLSLMSKTNQNRSISYSLINWSGRKTIQMYKNFQMSNPLKSSTQSRRPNRLNKMSANNKKQNSSTMLKPQNPSLLTLRIQTIGVGQLLQFFQNKTLSKNLVKLKSAELVECFDIRFCQYLIQNQIFIYMDSSLGQKNVELSIFIWEIFKQCFVIEAFLCQQLFHLLKLISLFIWYPLSFFYELKYLFLQPGLAIHHLLPVYLYLIRYHHRLINFLHFTYQNCHLNLHLHRAHFISILNISPYFLIVIFASLFLWHSQVQLDLLLCGLQQIFAKARKYFPQRFFFPVSLLNYQACSYFILVILLLIVFNQSFLQHWLFFIYGQFFNLVSVYYRQSQLYERQLYALIPQLRVIQHHREC